jgi:hypothetical protein
MTYNKETSDRRRLGGLGEPNFWTTLPGILTGLAGIITAVGGLYLGIHVSQNSKAPVQVNSPAQSIVGTYKWSYPFGEAYTISFYADGSAMQSNGDGGIWTMTAPGSYTLKFKSKWTIVDLTLDGPQIRGTVITPDGYVATIVGYKE